MMDNTEQRNSIMQMAKGAFQERVDYEMTRVIDNILDPNTKATAKRRITLTIELTPDDERENIAVAVQAKSTLASTNPVTTALFIARGRNGERIIGEKVSQIPGQIRMDGSEQEPPKLMKLMQQDN